MTKLALGLSVAALCGLSGTAFGIIGDPVISNGFGDITIEVLPASAGFTSELWLCRPDLTRDRFIATNRDVGTIVNIGTYPAGELIFCIHVVNTGNDFFTGPGTRNPDGLPHADVSPETGLSYLVGFEDILGGGDMDYNDNVFRFTGVIPAPATAGLFGLAGLVAARRRRA